jgi:hypothetical protein
MAVGAFAIGSAVGNVASAAVLDDIEKAEALVEGFKEAKKAK